MRKKVLVTLLFVVLPAELPKKQLWVEVAVVGCVEAVATVKAHGKCLMLLAATAASRVKCRSNHDSTQLPTNQSSQFIATTVTGK